MPHICGLAARLWQPQGMGAVYVYRGLGVVCEWVGVGGAGFETVSCLQSAGTRLTTPFGQPYALFGLCGIAKESYHPHLCPHSLPSSCMWSHCELNVGQFPSLATGHVYLHNFCHTLLYYWLFYIIPCHEIESVEISIRLLPT